MNQSRQANSAVLVLLVIALIALIGLSGFLYYKLRTTTQQAQTQVTQTEEAQTTGVSGEPHATQLETNPKEYSTPDYGLTFLYPSHYSIKNVAETPKKAITITFSDGVSNTLVVESTTIYTTKELSTYKDVAVGDVFKPDAKADPTTEWKLFYPDGITSEDTVTNVRAQIEKNGRLYSVTGKENLGTIFEILYTFKF